MKVVSVKPLLLIPAVALIVAGCGATKNVSVPAAPDTSTFTTSDAPSTPPTAAQTLLQLAGTGTKTTQKFTAAGDWDLAWSYNCASFGGNGNFQVFITADDPMTLVTPINQLGASGSSVEHYHDGGTFYFEVNSECAWNVKVTG